MEILKQAATVRALSKRSTIALCVHGINKKYCQTCLAKKPARTKKGSQPGASEAAE